MGVRGLFRTPHVQVTRDAVAFLIGAVAFMYEVFITGTDRPNVIMAATGLMAGAAYLRAIASGKKSS